MYCKKHNYSSVFLRRCLSTDIGSFSQMAELMYRTMEFELTHVHPKDDPFDVSLDRDTGFRNYVCGVKRTFNIVWPCQLIVLLE